MTQSGSEKSVREKRMVKDTFFSTPVYYAGLADAETLNEHLKKDIRAWQKQDPEGTVRSNVAQAGAWHSATDMHTRGSSTGLPGKSSSWSRGSTMSSATTPTSSRFATPCGRTSTPGTPTIGIIPIPMRSGAASIMCRRPTIAGCSTLPTRGHKRRYSRLISIRADGIPTPGTRCFINLWRVV